MEKEQVIIREVCPRDGWQNLPFIETERKKALIAELLQCGIPELEATSFVSPKWTPQMRDADAVAAWTMEAAAAAPRRVRISALVPNEKGAARAVAAGVDAVDIVMSISEYNNKMNLNMSVEESFEQVKRISALCRDRIAVRITFACVFGAYEGDPVDWDKLAAYGEACAGMGIERISVADSSGLAGPEEMRRVLRRMKAAVEQKALAVHIHDTRGLGILNCYSAYTEGVRQFDTALGGLGGCPFLPGASGNVSTEDSVRMFSMLGAETGINLDQLIGVGEKMHASVSGRYNSKLLDIALLGREKACSQQRDPMRKE